MIDIKNWKGVIIIEVWELGNIIINIQYIEYTTMTCFTFSSFPFNKKTDKNTLLSLGFEILNGFFNN